VTPEESRRITRYAERLAVPWWSWPGAVLVAAILAAEIGISLTELPLWAPAALLVVLTCGFMLWLSRIKVAVTETELRVDDARLPLAVISDVVALDAAGKREALGIGAHPLAFVIQRPWISGAVQVLLDDPDDPTPYWVISTRHPVELATELIGSAPLRGQSPDNRAG
jgi:hypothetical protein